MRRATLAFVLLILASFAGAEPAPILVDHACVDQTDRAIPKEFLDQARALRVLFGHQSVGGNILEGLSSLAEKRPDRYACEPANEPEASWFDENRGWGEFGVGENEDPYGKISHFRKKMTEEKYGRKLDAAMMKFCFVDFNEDPVKAKGTFEKYCVAMVGLKNAFPKLRLVWWTAPLQESENAGRNEFNRLVREYCHAHGEALFDLADIESHDAQGKEAREPGLCKAWSEDGGHLNDAGKVRAARAWWWLMARLAGWPGK